MWLPFGIHAVSLKTKRGKRDSRGDFFIMKPVDYNIPSQTKQFSNFSVLMSGLPANNP